MTSAAAKPLTLWVVTKDGTPLYKIEARFGLCTSAGPIVRVSEKSIWTLRKDFSTRQHRAYDGRLPSVFKSQALITSTRQADIAIQVADRIPHADRIVSRTAPPITSAGFGARITTTAATRTSSSSTASAMMCGKSR